MNDCVFCKIISGEFSSYKVYEDDNTLAFLSIEPESFGHTLVIPKKHISSLVNLNLEDEQLVGKIFTVINRIAKEEGVDKTGFRVVINCGEDGGQEVKHLHFHIIGGKKLGVKISG